MDLLNVALKTIDGKNTSLNEYKGKVMMIVNVASKCGLTPQYQEMESLYQKYRDQGFVILGFPANDFGSQEPGTNTEIQEFCSLTYGVDFPMFEKIQVTGEGKHPLYQTLTKLAPSASGESGLEEKLKGYGHTRKGPGEILWNFEKFLIDRQGKVLGRFSPDVKPNDEIIVKAIEKAL